MAFIGNPKYVFLDEPTLTIDYVKNHYNINYYLEEKGLSEQTNDILKNYIPGKEMYLQMNDKKCDHHELEDNDDYDINNDHNKLIINTNDPVEFPKIYKIKPFHCYDILFPISVIGIISSLSVISKFLVNYENYSAFSIDIYYNNSENNLPLNSNYHQVKLIWNINPEKTTILTITNSNFNKILNTSNHTYPYEITSYNDIELNDIGKSTGTIQFKYIFKSIVHALPITVNLISNFVFSYNNITQKIKTSFEEGYEHSFKNNKEYIIFNINSITFFFGITDNNELIYLNVQRQSFLQILILSKNDCR
ncbi:hypothetical protein PIROE2DRAFT_16879 [Piromyces sp. E2]|nr:hypothetical protein PIROE2DRAFT_16879 [Piromyces sp. E2]|eukprot:OUM57973.1 hypothetical protein PIROE2DRAFT_16879 [Piromyces sp. E2]